MALCTLATIEDVLRLSIQGERYELIDGELTPMSPTWLEHGDVEAYAIWVLNGYVSPRKLGKIVNGGVLFRLDPATKLARAPDIAYIRRERLRGIDLAGPYPGPPDRAVEIASPGDAAKDLELKVETWLGHGTLAVLLMYPANRAVVIWRNDSAVRLRGDNVIDLDPVLPGFRSVVCDLFPPDLDESDTSPEVELRTDRQ